VQLVGIQIYNLDIARIKNQRNEHLVIVCTYMGGIRDIILGGEIMWLSAKWEIICGGKKSLTFCLPDT